ncbi:MAG TPA: hypothetical protein VEQ40_06590 [Pyrinomonadaceae bacterium]|nr:hypothetical protein [Pyrinomonadaceae bacterium]
MGSRLKKDAEGFAQESVCSLRRLIFLRQLATGDLVVHPVPLVGSTSLPADYAATLRKLLDLKPKVIVPGHGAVMMEDAYVRRTILLLDSINRQAEAAVRRGETLEQARKSVRLEEFRKEFAGGSQLKSFIFQTYVAAPGVEAAYRQALAKPRS